MGIWLFLLCFYKQQFYFNCVFCKIKLIICSGNEKADQLAKEAAKEMIGKTISECSRKIDKSECSSAFKNTGKNISGRPVARGDQKNDWASSFLKLVAQVASSKKKKIFGYLVQVH